jgi:hypothetical protein
MKLDLRKILKDALEGTELYSTAHGVVNFDKVHPDKAVFYPITVIDENGNEQYFNKEGKLFNFKDAECILFPSKDNRDWSTFKLSKWRAKRGTKYCYISNIGKVMYEPDGRCDFDNELYAAGNYFRTEEDAKNSKIYKAFHEGNI